jgi:PleD family two-component response regulator
MDAWHPEEALMRACRSLEGARSKRLRSGLARTSRLCARPQVLLADDDPTVLSLVRATLLNYGMEVTGANSTEAMEQLRCSRPTPPS